MQRGAGGGMSADRALCDVGGLPPDSQLWVCGCAPEPSGVSHLPGLAQGNVWAAPSASGMCNLTPDRATDRLFGFRQKIPHCTERTYIERKIACEIL
jgi:hypothetical protein